jgi:hypothetical protein
MYESQGDVNGDRGGGALSFFQYRLFAILLGLVVIGVYSAFYVAQSDWPPKIEVRSLPESKTQLKNSIAILDASQSVWVVDPRSMQRRPLFDDTLQAHFPTWSRDGRLVASIATDATGKTGIYATAAAGGESVRIVGGDEVRPEYFNWSPDGNHIACQVESEGLKWGQVVSFSNQEEVFSVRYNDKVYWTWSEDGNHLLWNIDGLVSNMNMDSLRHSYPQRQLLSEFRAPSWSSNDGEFIYTDRFSLRLSRGERNDTTEPRLLFEAPDYSHVVASPDYSRFALTNFHRGRYGVGYIVERDNQLTPLPQRVRAMFWSPDGRFLAFWCNKAGETMAGGASPAARFRLEPDVERSENWECWWIFDLARNTQYPLVKFIPTEHCESMAVVFSQFHTSHRFWSPDSRYFLVPSVDPTSMTSHVWLLDVVGEMPPVNIGEGVFASWSWE